MKHNFFSIPGWYRRFKYAVNGLYASFRTEQTIWVHLAATICVIILSIFAHTTAIETIILTFATGLVWMAELFNTAIEKLADNVTKEYSASIKLVKDIAAAAVLITAIVALITGLIIFIPKFN